MKKFSIFIPLILQILRILLRIILIIVGIEMFYSYRGHTFEHWYEYTGRVIIVFTIIGIVLLLDRNKK